MRIVTKKEFVKLPSGTVFAKLEKSDYKIQHNQNHI